MERAQGGQEEAKGEAASPDPATQGEGAEEEGANGGESEGPGRGQGDAAARKSGDWHAQHVEDACERAKGIDNGATAFDGTIDASRVQAAEAWLCTAWPNPAWQRLFIVDGLGYGFFELDLAQGFTPTFEHVCTGRRYARLWGRDSAAADSAGCPAQE
jgi:hypothetical protein